MHLTPMRLKLIAKLFTSISKLQLAIRYGLKAVVLSILQLTQYDLSVF